MGEWGPWIEHDGGGCPVSVGTVLITTTETTPGKFFDMEAPVLEVDLPAYDWSNWGVPGPGGFSWGRVTRYRIRKPRGMTILQSIVTEPEKELEDA